jgi:hypothetical protein
MKKYLFACLLPLALVSCNDEKKEGAVLTVLPTLVEASADGVVKDIEVTSNTDWTVTSAADWCTVAPALGSNNGTFKVTVAENSNKTKRETNVTVSGGGLTKTIPVEQDALGFLFKRQMVGDWRMTEQYAGDAGNAVLGLYIMFHANDTASVFTDPTDPSVHVDGKWSINGNVLSIAGAAGSLSFDVTDTDPNVNWLKCNLTIISFGINGLPCKFERVVNE